MQRSIRILLQHLPAAAVAAALTAPTAGRAQTRDEIVPGGPAPKNICIPLDDDTALACGDGTCDARDTVPEACPADCKPSQIRSYNSLTSCGRAGTVHAPRSIAAVQNIVTAAARAGRSLRVVSARKDGWVASRYAHSANDQLCTDGDLISTENLKTIHGPVRQFEGQETIEVDPGVTMHALAEYLHRNNRSLGYAVFGFRQATIAGAAATGSHGSSPVHPTVVASRVVGLTVVTADGRVREFSEGTTDADTWKALRANLGYLGAVVRLKLRVEPKFNLEVSVTLHHGSDKLLEAGGPFKLVEGCDWGQIMWFPQANSPDFARVFVMCGKRTDKPATPGAESRLFKPDIGGGTARWGVEQMQHIACERRNLCLMESLNATEMMTRPPYEKMKGTGGLFSSVVGVSHRLMSSELPPRQPIPIQRDWEMAIPRKHAHTVLREALETFKRHDICLPLVGVFIRFSLVEDTTLLAHTVAQGDFVKGEPMMFFEAPVFLPRGMRCPEMARYEKPFSELAERLVGELGARPHWAKNRRSLFVHQKNRRYPQYGDHIERFRRVVERLDPRGMFANQFGVDALGLRWPERTRPVSADTADRPCVNADAALPPSDGGCPINWEKDGLLCYPPCHEGFDGVGPVCWQDCPPAYKNDGLTCRRDVDIRSKDHYGRGVGYVAWERAKCEREHPQGCERNAAMWYPKCRDGYHAVGCCICRQRGCPSGYKDDGATCRRDAHIFGKKSYGRGVGEKPRW
jgi:FAD/FMN-containing dehydrogenase